MSVEFKERRGISSAKKYNTNNSFMVNALIEMGIVKSVRSANIVLISVIVICSVIGIWFYWQKPSDGQILYREDIPDELVDQIPDDQLRKIPSRK